MVTFAHTPLARTGHMILPIAEDQEIQSYHVPGRQRDGNTWWIVLMRAIKEMAMESQKGRGAADIPDLY